MRLLQVFIGLTLLLITLSAKATTFDENMCLAYGKTAANISIVVATGATYADLLKLLNNKDFHAQPKDVQELIKATAKFLTSTGAGNGPEYNFQGATDFCIRVGGDVPTMTHYILKALGTEI